MMVEVKKLSRLHQNYLAGFLRLQLTELQNVLRNVENSERYDDDYVFESMRRIEHSMRRFRKACHN